MREMNSFVATPEIAHAIGLTNPVKISDKQVNWVRDTLARNPKPQWTFLVMHKPAWKSQDPQFAKIQEMLASRPHTVIGGHTHYFTHEIVDGHDYINMATCGGIRARPGPGNIDAKRTALRQYSFGRADGRRGRNRPGTSLSNQFARRRRGSVIR